MMHFPSAARTLWIAAFLLGGLALLTPPIRAQVAGPAYPGYQYGAWSVYGTPAGPVTGYRFGPWSVYQTPAGPATGYRIGPWSVYETPGGPVTGYRFGPWTSYQTPAGPITEYRTGNWSVWQGAPNAGSPVGPYRAPGLMLPAPPAQP
jgi:hypothetical protein